MVAVSLLLPIGGGGERKCVRLRVNCDAEWLRRKVKVIHTTLYGLASPDSHGSHSHGGSSSRKKINITDVL